MTAEQLAELPDDGWRHELIEGELSTMPPAGWQHGRVTNRLTRFVDRHVEANHLGECVAAETGFVLRRDPDTVRAPDLAFVRAGRLPDKNERKFSTVIPDLVIEVVSPSDRAGEVNQQALSYLDAGVRLVWVVYPETDTITAHQPGGMVTLFRGEDAVLSGEDVLPGLTARLGDIFG